jgi:hypothetical protein
MQNLFIEKTHSTPFIHFNTETGRLQIRGESFPENAAKFYTPVLEWIHEYLEQNPQQVKLEFKITYFNSSSSKVFMMLLDTLENEAARGRNILVKWICDGANDIAIECGEEFKEDLERLPFEIEILH